MSSQAKDGNQFRSSAEAEAGKKRGKKTGKETGKETVERDEKKKDSYNDHSRMSGAVHGTVRLRQDR